jgi:ABC-2 type transport system permease protein
MHKVWRLEMLKYARDPTIGGLGALIIGLLSLLFYRLCVDYLQLAHDHIAQSQRTISVSVEIFKPFCSWAMIFFALLIPILTTTSISREYRQQSFILWASSALSAYQIVMGKWLSILSLVSVIIMGMLCMIATLGLETTLDYGLIFSALLSVMLVSSCFISFGLCVSSMIPHPHCAMGVTFIGNILWILLEWISPFPDKWRSLSEELSLFGHLDHFLNGIITSKDVTYYLAFTSVFLSFTIFLVHQKMTRIKG